MSHDENDGRGAASTRYASQAQAPSFLGMSAVPSKIEHTFERVTAPRVLTTELH